MSSRLRVADFRARLPFTKELVQLQENGMHDRFVIVDGLTAYSVGHSLKDLGSKDSVISKSPDPGNLVNLFEERWAVAEIKLWPKRMPSGRCIRSSEDLIDFTAQ